MPSKVPALDCDNTGLSTYRHRPVAWLRDAVFYEIYPQSFYDSNGDGIGDLPGIISKLEYVRSLGCNAIWLNPCFVSPFQDAGYDVADFYRVAPRYGTNADLKQLFSHAKRLGIRICLDLVAGHTSVEHPWFKASAQPELNKYSNWYIWTNNWWESAEGFQAISGHSDRNGKYITNFFYFQPALNYGFANPDPKRPWQLGCDHPDVQAVRAEMRKIIRFWLDMGASGFRVDMAPSLVKNDRKHLAVRRFWLETRRMMDRDYPEAVLISEWGVPPEAIRCGFDVDFMLPFMPENRRLFTGPESRGIVDYTNAYFSRNGSGDAMGYFDRYLDYYRRSKGRGYISIPTGNHDTERLNFQRSESDLELIFAFILTMPGIPFIYYGDEIGMRQIQPMRSKEGAYNRTPARTPMQWTPGRNAGFSKASPARLYLPIDPAVDRPNVAEQESRSASLLHRVRELVAFRRSHPALCADGAFEMLFLRPRTYPLIYLRHRGSERFVIAMNPSGTPVSAPCAHALLKGDWTLVRGSGKSKAVGGTRHRIDLKAGSYAIWSVK